MRRQILAASTAALLGALGALFGPFARGARAQDRPRTVADGIYTDAQATRGAASYDSECSGCHRADLSGNTGPALKDQRFARSFAGKDLRTFFTRISTTMPRNAPASLAEDVYLDIVAHVLKENGFPAGSTELASDALGAIRVVPGRAKALPPVGDFSYVEVVGCLAPASPHGWMLTRATDPVAAATKPSARADWALGVRTFALVDAMAYAPELHKGQKMYVRGLLIKASGEQRLTISAFETLSPTCNE